MHVCRGALNARPYKRLGAHLQVTTGDCPHLLFYGPPGSGKKTLIVALLKEIYGNGAEKVTSETQAKYI